MRLPLALLTFLVLCSPHARADAIADALRAGGLSS